MKRLLQITLPVVFLALGILCLSYFIRTKPEPRQRSGFTAKPEVQVRPLSMESYQVMLNSQGTVQARTTSTLIPEVRGRILSISSNFREGGFFEEGDVLLEIDPSDYETELIVAEANLAQAELAEAEEQARYDQAKQDWERLHPGAEASPLALREPQIKRARAATASAQARVETARRNLERTKIQAPFAGRILSKNVDVGQYVSPGNQLARLYAVDFAEVRLPLTASQFAYLNLPSVYRGENPTFREGPPVTLISRVSGQEHSWHGRIVRAEGAVDTTSRLIFVVAQIRNPYGRDSDHPDRPPLKVGAYVEAKIEGKTLENVFVVPRKLLRENDFVLMVDEDNYLVRKSVEIVWQTDDVMVVTRGLEEGENLCLTNVPFSLEGWAVNPVPEETMLAEADSAAPVLRRPAPQGGGSWPDRVDGIIAAMGEGFPADLRSKLEASKESSDPSARRPLMGEVREWAEANGKEMPARSGGGPRG